MKNPYLVRCYICKKIIDKRKARQDEKRHYIYFKNTGICLHLKDCFGKYYGLLKKM